ncbi:MAG TPA: hypothetical protein VMV90_09785 [Rectinemataceae bacterium]|nr:hypothetical protein [Rectinemataceae bacterium]
MRFNASADAALIAGKPFSLILVKRASVFAAALCGIETLYWYVGSFQSFLDATQVMLMMFLRWSALGLLLTALLGLALSIAFALFRRYPLRVGGFVVYILLVLLASGALMLADSLIILHRGLP